MGVIGVSMIAEALASALYLAPLLHRSAVASTARVPSPPSMTTVSGETITFSFISGRTGWAAAAVTTDRLWIYGTGDGARSWRQLGSIDFLQETRVDELRFFDRSHGLVVLGTDAVFAYRTADGGRHWTSVPMPDTPVLHVTFTDPQHGWAGTGFSDTGTSRLFSTVDGGTRGPSCPLRRSTAGSSCSAHPPKAGLVEARRRTPSTAQATVV